MIKNKMFVNFENLIFRNAEVLPLILLFSSGKGERAFDFSTSASVDHVSPGEIRNDLNERR